MRNYVRWSMKIAVLLVGLSVSACDPISIAQIEAVSVMGSDKTVVDHVVSVGSGKDCSTLRKQQGLTYCVEDMPEIRPNIYCYKDQGGVTCYDRSSPNNSRQQRVDRNDHNLPK